MNRTAIFAHYDKNNKIEDYVIYYLEGLKKVSQNIIFVSDSNIEEKELEKIANITTNCITGQHGEYDFGSYKRGFIYANENNLLENCDELIFANDSCYGPLFPLEEMFEKMTSKNVDFWGPTININESKKSLNCNFHIQSFFLVFKPQVFNWEGFKNFIYSIKKQNSKEDIIKEYEIGLSVFLQENGYKCDCYSKICKFIPHSHVAKYKDLILKDRVPLIKRNVILKKEIKHIYPTGTKALISKTKYNYNLIKKDYLSNKANLTKLLEFNYYCKHLKRKIIRFSLKNKTLILFENLLIKLI